MPAERRRDWESLLATADEVRRRARLEAYLDAGHGACRLKEPRIARLVQETLLHFDGDRYRLLAWVVMPNHVHVLIGTMDGHPLHAVVQAWKSFTSRHANRILGRAGTFWQPEYFDRFVRNEAHFEAAVRYIHENPVKAHLVGRAEDWQFSSARHCVSPGSAGVLARNRRSVS